MSVLPRIPRGIARSRWVEPIAAAIGAAVLGWGFSATKPPMAMAPASPPSPNQELMAQGTSPAPDPRELIARTTNRRIRLMLKPPTAEPHGHLYRIRWGDTLWGLAQRFHIPLTALEEANHLTGSDILVGSYLVIPQTYRVQLGDTLASVARKFDVPLLLLWHENRLQRDKLSPGESLVIPFTGAPPKATYGTPAIGPVLANRGLPGLPAALTPEDLLMVAHLVQSEAGNQPFLGQVAVAAVVLNRLKTPGFPKTVDGVLFSPGQFETVSNGTFWQAPGPLATMAAKAAAAGWDPTGGALYFYNPTMPHVAWMNALPETAVIGDQVFCR